MSKNRRVLIDALPVIHDLGTAASFNHRSDLRTMFPHLIYLVVLPKRASRLVSIAGKALCGLAANEGHRLTHPCTVSNLIFPLSLSEPITPDIIDQTPVE